MTPVVLIGSASVEAAFDIGRETRRKAERDGYIPPRIPRHGNEPARWIAGEIDEIARARVAGKSREEIRALVQRLVAERATKYAPQVRA
jgi:hypothetical protein